jgi:hypothetical protein
MRFNFSLEYSIQNLQDNQVGVNLSKTHQFMLYGNDVNLLLLGDKKYCKEAIVYVPMEDFLEVSPERRKYILISRYKNAGKIQNKKTANRPFENVAKFICLGMTVTSQNCIHVENMSSLTSDNVCYHLVQKLVSSRMLFKVIQIEM